jgi:hypothetical protein
MGSDPNDLAELEVVKFVRRRCEVPPVEGARLRQSLNGFGDSAGAARPVIGYQLRDRMTSSSPS